MKTAEINLYEIFLTKFSKTEAKKAVAAIEEISEKNIDKVEDSLATKEDISEVRIEIQKVKTDLIMWLVALIIGLFLAIVGSIIAILSYMS